jgi:hypothetical protein
MSDKKEDGQSLPKSPRLEFWFSRDPTIPIPALKAYEIQKQHNQIPADMTYEGFLKFYNNS